MKNSFLIVFFLMIVSCTQGQSKLSNMNTLVNIDKSVFVPLQKNASFGVDFNAWSTLTYVSDTYIKVQLRMGAYDYPHQFLFTMREELSDGFNTSTPKEKRLTWATNALENIRYGKRPINPKRPNDDSNYLSYSFVDDLLLFQSLLGNSVVELAKSGDTDIPLRIVTNYPLFLANGQNSPQVLNDNLSIKIK